jgi:hypothetical protein
MDRRPVRHAGDRVRLHDVLTFGIAPDPAAMAVQRFFGRVQRWQLVDVGPLLEDLLRVGGLDRLIRIAMPDRNLWPRTGVRGGRADPVAPLLSRTLATLKDDFKSFL